MESNTKNKVISSMFWKLSERIGAQLVSLIVSIILARLIAPEEYGLIALITIFITISNVFIESGFGTALIQKKDADDLDFSSVFYFNIVVAIIAYILLYFSAPTIAHFYNNMKLIAIIRVFGITLIIAGLKSIQNAYVSKNMIFKKFFISTSIGTIISAIVGIFMAYKGFGVWSLVVQQLANTTIDTCILWITVKWRPIFKFSLFRLRKMFSFGWKMLISSLIDTFYNQMYGLVIGKFYSSENLAYFNKGNQFPELITTNVNGSISSVMLPALSNEQDNKIKLKNMMKKAIKTSAFVLFPMMLGLAAIAESLVKIILTDKWIQCVPILQMLCFSYLLWPVHTINLQAISSLGRSDIYLKLEIIKKAIGVILLIITIPFGIEVMVFGKILMSLIATFINAYPNKKLLKYSYTEQIKDLTIYLCISIIMFIVIYPIQFLNINLVLILIMQIIFGIIIYLSLAYLFKLEAFKYIIELIKTKFKEKKDV